MNARDADIDTVCVVPAHIDVHRDFFGMEEPTKPGTGNFWESEGKLECVLQHILETDARVTELVAVSDTHTPILTFNFNQVEIDIACGTLATKHLPESLLAVEDKYLLGIGASYITFCLCCAA